ncbi:MAG: DNA polymerase/3'-5' exonuclease PolX [Candidatus Omnitrophica bacterium]|nr:DNA polymerase/3'-5' exonuclease PolX [Candidatus Omnitrophota bacterium]
MRNLEVADIFDDIADFLELKNENPFRIRAYRRASQNIKSLNEDIEEILKRDGLLEILGIGKDLALKIKEIITEGRLKYLEELKREFPEGLAEIMNIPNIGPKTAKLLYEKLNIRDIDTLEEYAKAHRLSSLPGIREKTEENILKGIELVRRGRERMSLGIALPLAEKIINDLKDSSGIKRITYAGSLRRMKETIRDIDILVSSNSPNIIMDNFVKLPVVKEIISKGKTKSSILTKEGIQVDIRVVKPDSYGAAMVYFTGSKAHNIRIRELANKKGFKINEYGVFRKSDGKKIAGNEEIGVYNAIGLPYIEPELREDQDEIEAAINGRLPDILKLEDIKSDLHIHTKYSDGANSLKKIIDACKELGYEYIAICDHSKSLKVAGGLSEKDLMKQVGQIRKFNKISKDIKILAGSEVDILDDGSLDFDGDILKELDLVVASIHTGFKQAREKLTYRILKAMENKYVNVISHPTGRLMGARDAYELNLDRIFKQAADTNTAIEINAFPQRLDLTDINCKRAREFNVNFAIGTDTHSLPQLNYIRFGVAVARRGWIEAGSILNALSFKEFLKRIKK